MQTNKYEKIQLALEAAFFMQGKTDKQKQSLLAKIAVLPASALEHIMKLCVRAEKEASQLQRGYLAGMESLLQRARELKLVAKNEALTTEKNQDVTQAMAILKKLSNA